LNTPHHISFHYISVKTVRRNGLEHKPKANKNTDGLKRNICFCLTFDCKVSIKLTDLYFIVISLLWIF